VLIDIDSDEEIDRIPGTRPTSETAGMSFVRMVMV